MSKPLRVEAEAEAELWAAADWYDSERSGLGDELLVAVRDKLDEIQTHPTLAPRSPSASGELPLRQARLDRFPYLIVYMNLESEVWVIAFAHVRREPGYWRSRLES